jgi:hypothetical protein
VRRLVIYDRTCTSGQRGLSPVWAAGARLYRALGYVDDARGVASWDEAFGWLGSQREPIGELQYWGHGKWGTALIGDEAFRAESISERRGQLAALRERLTGDALVWFRTCETLGARAGHDFAMQLADTLGARIAGHTYIIGFHQSGLRGLSPGTRPDWAADDGLDEGTPEEPRRAKWSRPWAPRTIRALTPAVPRTWFSQARLQ